MARNPRLHDDAPLRREQPVAAERDPSAPEGRAAKAAWSAGAGAWGGVARLLCGPQHLIDEALRLASALVADTARANAEVIAGIAHRCKPLRDFGSAVPERALNRLMLCQRAAREPTVRHGERQVMSMTWMTTGEPLLSRRLMVVLSRHLRLTTLDAMFHAMPRRSASQVIVAHPKRHAVQTGRREAA